MDLHHHWYLFYYDRKETDQRIQPFLSLKPLTGWLKAAREALFLSKSEVARRLNVSLNTYLKAEEREAAGTITVAHLESCADAMNCDLIYAIRPRDGRRFSEAVWNQISVDLNPPNLLHKLLSRQYDERFRKAQGWCRNRSGPWHEYTRLAKVNRDINYAKNAVRRGLPPD